MDYSEFLTTIQLPEKIKNTLISTSFNPPVYENYKALFFSDTERFIDSLKKEPSLLLSLYTLFAFQQFSEKEVANNASLCVENYFDISIWSQKYWELYHGIGLCEPEWVALSLKKKVFRIGRLQFEPGKFETDMVINEQIIAKGTPVLHVHIPEDGALKKANCEESFKKAKMIFPEYHFFDCSSWLLAPNLKFILAETSNILIFQNLFTILEEDLNDQQAIERIFQFSVSKNETTLQKKARKWLAKGNKIGSGYGVIYSDRYE